MSSRLATRSRCDVGSKAMLPMCVPRLRTCALTDGGVPEALMTKRSMSASVYGVTELDASEKTLTAPLAPVTVLKLTDCVPPPDRQTNAFSLLSPANRTSVGSSPTSIVRVTLPVERSTTLTESESQLTTQASRLLRA